MDLDVLFVNCWDMYLFGILCFNFLWRYFFCIKELCRKVMIVKIMIICNLYVCIYVCKIEGRGCIGRLRIIYLYVCVFVLEDFVIYIYIYEYSKLMFVGKYGLGENLLCLLVFFRIFIIIK